MSHTYDPKCYELAKRFIDDKFQSITDERRHQITAELSADIQACIEDFLEWETEMK